MANLLTPRARRVECASNFSMPTHYLACDLGADSGRLMLGTLDNGKITVEELHRFPNGPVKTSGALHWDFDRAAGTN